MEELYHLFGIVNIILLHIEKIDLCIIGKLFVYA